MSQIFQHVPASPPDGILHLNTLFAADSNPKKVSLGVGAYRDGNGKPWLLPSVAAAEKIIVEDPKKYHKEYPPIQGHESYLKAARFLMFGDELDAVKEGRIASCQAISGTGALHVAMDFIRRNLPESAGNIYLPSITWPNHIPIFHKVFREIEHKTYTYVKPGTLSIAFEDTIKDISEAPEHSIFLMHACAHNPTGIDFTKEQWDRVCEVVVARGHICMFDSAYQGFATGSFERDAYAPRLFASRGVELIICQSFSKNFGLYAERAGCVHILHNSDPSLTANIVSGLKSIVRATYSVNPQHGAYIVSAIVENPELLAQFYIDVETMSKRISDMRQAIYDELIRIETPGSWEHMLTAIGMFTFTGLTKQQVLYMREHYSVYLVPNGRMAMCGLTEHNYAHVAAAMKDAVIHCQE
eukprot:gnl/Dysnectes_brevis/698_a770_3286.p1 GENE.gnl/Dysnectes_brevis/698_a770_3286~~gnl/Dysnectes_brevis/698_a770_3286.p1  ORF type:complete len:413 (-),score=176.79 gnl/Dysnectes_brevis/698_a770_3286:34-1272(-)